MNKKQIVTNLLNDFDNEMVNTMSYDIALQKVMLLTKKQMLTICSDIPDFEGHNWTKIEGAKFLIANYVFK